MSRAAGAALGLLVAAALLLIGASCFYRVVRTPWGTVLLQKPRPSLGGTYIDTRGWSARDFMQHWELSKELMKRGLDQLQQKGQTKP